MIAMIVTTASLKTKVFISREPDDDWQEKERLVEEAVERLDIVIVDSDPRLLLELVVNPICPQWVLICPQCPHMPAVDD